jgi:Mg2+-importing ATPase
MIPADGVLLDSNDLFINQSSLTGESLPVEKLTLTDENRAENADKPAVDLPNLLFMGTDVLSGQGTILILKTGKETFFGDIAKSATGSKAETAFEIGLKRVSALLLKMIAILFPIVFILNVITKHDVNNAFFFAIAVAVGLTPEMLPMIVNSNLAKGAQKLAKEKVIVKNCLPSKIWVPWTSCVRIKQGRSLKTVSSSCTMSILSVTKTKTFSTTLTSTLSTKPAGVTSWMSLC